MINGLVSIIIPTFNRAHFLGETLESILFQTFTNWECIIIDDGSKDNTEAIVKHFLKRDARFKYHKRPENYTKGANSCRNFGFEISEGEFIQWFDSDDIMMPTHVEDLLMLLKKNKLDFAVADSVNFNDETKELEGKPYHFDRTKFTITANLFATQQIGWITDDFLGRRSSINNLKFNTEILTDGDEYNFFTRYLLNSDNGVFLNKTLTRRRIHRDAISNPEKYNDTQMHYKVSQIKLLTYRDIKHTNNIYLRKWFLKGYMLNSYYLSKCAKPLYKLNMGFLYIVREYSIIKAFAFIMSLLFGLIFKKGYSLMRYART